MIPIYTSPFMSPTLQQEIAANKAQEEAYYNSVVNRSEVYAACRAYLPLLSSDESDL